jgi:transporter family protein
MSWIEASLVSALFLGGYDLCIKHAIRDNAVLPVLFLSTLTGATVWLVLLFVQAEHPGLLPATLVTDPLTPVQHLQLRLESAYFHPVCRLILPDLLPKHTRFNSA